MGLGRAGEGPGTSHSFGRWGLGAGWRGNGAWGPLGIDQNSREEPPTPRPMFFSVPTPLTAADAADVGAVARQWGRALNLAGWGCARARTEAGTGWGPAAARGWKEVGREHELVQDRRNCSHLALFLSPGPPGHPSYRHPSVETRALICTKSVVTF